MKQLLSQSWDCEKLINIVLISVTLHYSFHQLKPEDINSYFPEKSSIAEKIVCELDIVTTRRTSNSNLHHLSKLIRMVSTFTFERFKRPEDLSKENINLKNSLTAQRHPFPLRI